MTGSPVKKVLEAGQDTNGDTYLFVYGNVLSGNENDDRYAWVRARDGVILPGSINDEPVRGIPAGLVRLVA